MNQNQVSKTNKVNNREESVTLLLRKYPSYGLQFIVRARGKSVRAAYAYMTSNWDGIGAIVPGRVIAQMVANSKHFATIAADNEEKFETRRDYYPIERQLEKAKREREKSLLEGKELMTRAARGGKKEDHND